MRPAFGFVLIAARNAPITATELLGTVEQIYRELEAQWATIIGPDDVERLRADLVRVLSDQNGGRLPPVSPTW